VQAPEALPEGPVTLMIRPESVHVDREQPAGDVAALTGTVIGVSFLGSYTRLTVETAAGRVVAARPNVDGPRTPGQFELLDKEVRVWWWPTDAVITSQA
jgi:ABC-type Fe3+/spermidine/putrescine transport system ATPase subunit